MIYLDNHATTPCDPRVVEAMLPYLLTHFGNPHSDSHAMGRDVADVMTQSIATIAARLNAPAEQTLITSGATESINLAMRGVLDHPRCRHRRLVICTTEHPATIDVADDLQRAGIDIIRIPVCAEGMPDLDALRDALKTPTGLVSIMWANNETGVIAPIPVIAEIVHDADSLLHCDATQAVGRLPVDMRLADVDLLTGSAHKFYGPKGIGFLIAGNGQRRVRLKGQIVGGGQQRGLRSGTMNPAGVIAMATALSLATRDLQSTGQRIASLRDRLWRRLDDAIAGLRINGPPLDSDRRLPGNLNFQLPDVEGETWMSSTPGVAFSSGSACSSVDGLPSHVLRSMGLTESEARRSVRFGIGRLQNESEVDAAADELIAGYRKVSRS